MKADEREIPYCSRINTQTWVVLLIGRAAWEICFNQSEALSCDTSSVWNFCAGGETRGGVAKCRQVVAVRLRFPPDSSPVVSLCLSLVARGVWWEGWKRERESSSLFSSHHPLLPPRALREDDWGRVRVSSFYSSWLSMKMIESLTLVNSSNDTLESCCRLLLVRIPAISSSTWSSASAGPVTILNKLNNSWYDNCPSPSLSKTWNATAVNQW